MYRMTNELIPLKFTYVSYGLDNDSRCEFCKINYETKIMFFYECSRIKALWTKVENMTSLNLYNDNIVNFKHHQETDKLAMIVYITALLCNKI